MRLHEKRCARGVRVLAVVAVVFGLLTIASGGRTLFSAGAREAAGSYVPFVLWFNFLVGFGYVVAGVGLWRRQRWAMWLSFVIAAATVAIFAAFGMRIWAGGAFELRTVGAMGLRTLVWIVTSIAAYRHLHALRPRQRFDVSG